MIIDEKAMRDDNQKHGLYVATGLLINPLEPDDAKTQLLFRALLWENGDRYELTLFGSR